jgi:hypothetical protein
LNRESGEKTENERKGEMSIQQCLPGINPKDRIAEKAPESEKKVYEALKDAIPKEWYA